MRWNLPMALALAAGLSDPLPEHASGAEHKETRGVGQIFIVGNFVTPHNIILSQLSLYPGQRFLATELGTVVEKAEQRLTWLKVFGIRGEVCFLDPEEESEFLDVLVTVEESRVAHLFFRPWEVAWDFLNALN